MPTLYIWLDRQFPGQKAKAFAEVDNDALRHATAHWLKSADLRRRVLAFTSRFGQRAANRIPDELRADPTCLPPSAMVAALAAMIGITTEAERAVLAGHDPADAIASSPRVRAFTLNFFGEMDNELLTRQRND